LWIFWPSFNGALVTGDARYRAIINTYFSLSASVLASFVTSMFVDRKRKIDIVCNSVTYSYKSFSCLIHCLKNAHHKLFI